MSFILKQACCYSEGRLQEQKNPVIQALLKSACVTFVNISLAKGSHVASTRAEGSWQGHVFREGEESESLLWPATWPLSVHFRFLLRTKKKKEEKKFKKKKSSRTHIFRGDICKQRISLNTRYNLQNHIGSNSRGTVITFLFFLRESEGGWVALNLSELAAFTFIVVSDVFGLFLYCIFWLLFTVPHF